MQWVQGIQYLILVTELQEDISLPVWNNEMRLMCTQQRWLESGAPPSQQLANRVTFRKGWRKKNSRTEFYPLKCYPTWTEISRSRVFHSRSPDEQECAFKMSNILYLRTTSTLDNAFSSSELWRCQRVNSRWEAFLTTKRTWGMSEYVDRSVSLLAL